VLRIGLTGGIASGKTTVRQVFERTGIPMLDADALTHEFFAPGGELVETVAAHFGAGVLGADGGIDRRTLGARVFQNSEEREWLNSVVHPRIWQRIGKFLEQEDAEGRAVAGVEAALMVETGSAANYDRLVVVVCRPEQQLERLVERSGMSPQEARLRLAAQMDPLEKARQADDLVDASGSLEETEAAAAVVARALLQRAGG
jgi:dephospho-CoA kinase